MSKVDRARAYAQRIRDYADITTRQGSVMGAPWIVDAGRTSPGNVSVWFPTADLRVSSFGEPSDAENLHKALIAARGVMQRRESEQADGCR